MANQPILAENDQFNNKTHPLVSVDAVGGLGLGGYVTLSQGWTLGQPKGRSNEFPEKNSERGERHFRSNKLQNTSNGASDNINCGIFSS